MLKNWGTSRQNTLDSMNILVIGAGGLGCSLCLTLVGSIGMRSRVTIMDDDVVELSNLHRQSAYNEDMCGKSKAECLANACRERNSLVDIIALNTRFVLDNSIGLVDDVDVIFDCTDNVQTRLLISDAWRECGRKNILVSASCVGWCGQVVTLVPNSQFCMRCVYGQVSAEDCGGQCSNEGVMGPVVAIIGNLQFLQLINYVVRGFDGGPERPNMLLMDCATNFTTSLNVLSSCSHCTSSLLTAHSVAAHSVDDVHIHTVEEISEIDDINKYTIIDVRESGPFSVSRIVGSVNIPASKLNVLYRPVMNSEQPVLVVCKRGITSLKYAQILAHKYPETSFLSLKGGLAAFGLPMP